MSKKRMTHTCLFLVALLFFSCGWDIRTRSLLGGKLHMAVEIEENANRNSPVAMDMVFVYDEKLLEQLIKMPAKEWFANREQIRRDHPEGEAFERWGWEWVPGQKIPLQEMPLKAGAEAIVFFADYLSPGAHRVRTDPFRDIRIRLGEDDFHVETPEQ